MMILLKLMANFNFCKGANAPPQQPQQPSGGGQDNVRDYSQEWANYYRQLGRVDEAEAIERQIKVFNHEIKQNNIRHFKEVILKQTRGGPPSGPPGAGSYPEGNFQQQQQPQQYGQQQQQYGQYGNYNYQQYGQNNSNDKNW
jgi:far upstream element-binding protein